MTLPTLFIPHGAGPCFFMEWTRGPKDDWDRTAAWLKGLIAGLPERPKAILVVSGHWEEDAFTVSSADHPPLIYDYYGFPEHTYRLAFDAPGAPALAGRIKDLIEAAGLPARADAARGYDHGVFVPLKLVTPEADIPVVQLSLKSDLDPEAHLAVGRALAPLRDEGVLIVGSGMSWHNMGGFTPAFTAKSQAFDAWLGEAMADPARRDDAIRHWDEAPYAREAHPREEHLAPLFVAAGAAEGEPGRVAFRDQVMDVVVSGFEFGG
ncbi:class III extradiol ring-cleavage dioxygenase [Phenylobacterium sp.]|uniref:DODA-type extradiol aromatic ring-opening family dioxygenase n=1 Tax=Phenylobacterium sp. TaxID=1871053 RepID=UPI002DE7D068|nr:class III extradiol ring-cleavage dioxygenase [Phenylobacterium sp.]